jgi:hypothetical protein
MLSHQTFQSCVSGHGLQDHALSARKAFRGVGAIGEKLVFSQFSPKKKFQLARRFVKAPWFCITAHRPMWLESKSENILCHFAKIFLPGSLVKPLAEQAALPDIFFCTQSQS